MRTAVQDSDGTEEGRGRVYEDAFPRPERGRDSGHVTHSGNPAQQPHNLLCYLRVTHVRPSLSPSNWAVPQGHSTYSGYLS